jgi:hypothetical protein
MFQMNEFNDIVKLEWVSVECGLPGINPSSAIRVEGNKRCFESRKVLIVGIDKYADDELEYTVGFAEYVEDEFIGWSVDKYIDVLAWADIPKHSTGY